MADSLQEHATRRPVPAIAFCVAFIVFLPAASRAQSALPDAPAPAANLIASAAVPTPQMPFPPQATPNRHLRIPSLSSSYIPLPRPCRAQSCTQSPPPAFCCQSNPELFQVYLEQTATRVYTPRDLALLATRSVIDPFNLLTIVGTSAYTVGTDSHSPYGPGMKGWGRLSAVSLGQDATGEFFGTFLIPSLTHQDPHYHRMPNASLSRRIFHCIVQPFWTVSDTGQAMTNYATLIGGMADEAVDNAYVPYRQVGWSASAQRVSVAWATAPIGNFVTEFVPDVARHINLNVVFVQRIINQVAIEEGGGMASSPPPP